MSCRSVSPRLAESVHSGVADRSPSHKRRAEQGAGMVRRSARLLRPSVRGGTHRPPVWQMPSLRGPAAAPWRAPTSLPDIERKHHVPCQTRRSAGLQSVHPLGGNFRRCGGLRSRDARPKDRGVESRTPAEFEHRGAGGQAASELVPLPRNAGSGRSGGDVRQTGSQEIAAPDRGHAPGGQFDRPGDCRHHGINRQR